MGTICPFVESFSIRGSLQIRNREMHICYLGVAVAPRSDTGRDPMAT